MQDWKPRGYVLDRVLGSGASADVWGARVAATGDAVALKRIVVADRDQVRRARAEAALLSALDHPNLVRLHALVSSGDSLVLVLDLADHGSLRDLLRARGRLTPGEVITALAPTAAAVSYLHSQSIVHGDVSAANILFTGSGTPLLGDVGVARITGDERDAESTPIYVDPAVAGGAAPGRASDVFMLGAVAFHALTGEPLWDGDSVIAILSRAVGGVPADVAERLAAAGAPAAMIEVVARALGDEPCDRGSAVEFALDLRHSGTPTAVEFAAGRPVPEPLVPDRTGSGTSRAGEPGSGTSAAAPPAARPPGAGRHRADRHDEEVGDHSAEPGTYPRQPRARPRVSAADEPGRPAFDRPGPVAASPAEPPTRLIGPRPRPEIPRAARTARDLVSARARAVAVGLLLVVAGAVVLVVAWPDGARGTSAAPSRPTGASGSVGATTRPSTTRPSGEPTDAAYWTRVLAQLDAVRAQAYAARRPELLARVYTPGALLSADTAQLRRLVPQGCGLTGALTGYRAAGVTVAGSRTVLTVLARLPASRLVCDGVAGPVAPAVAAQRLKVELVRTRDGPRIAAETSV